MEAVGVKNNRGSRAISEKVIILYYVCKEVIIGLRAVISWLWGLVGVSSNSREGMNNNEEEGYCRVMGRRGCVI
jgi:hypothetical protein